MREIIMTIKFIEDVSDEKLKEKVFIPSKYNSYENLIKYLRKRLDVYAESQIVKLRPFGDPTDNPNDNFNHKIQYELNKAQEKKLKQLIKFRKHFTDEYILSGSEEFSEYKLTVAPEDYANLLLELFDIRYEDFNTIQVQKANERISNSNNTSNDSNTPIINGWVKRNWYIQNYNDGLWRELNIEALLVILSKFISIPKINITDDIYRRFRSIDINQKLYFPDKTYIKKFNPQPNHIILFLNGVLNLKTMEFSKDPNYFGQFDFITRYPFNFLPQRLVNKLYWEVIERVLNDWAENDKEKLIYLKQLIISAMDGNGRGAYHIITGPGGNGKSTFLQIITKLVNEHNIAPINLHEIGDDNLLQSIHKHTKAIIGHDSATNNNMSKTLTSRFKYMVTNEAFQINVKYEHARTITTPCLKIQLTNTEPEFYENSDAMKRRIKYYEWTSKNFSKLTKEDSAFNLDELVGLNDSMELNYDFYEAVISNVFHDMEYFTHYIEIQSVVDATNELLEANDNLTQFINELEFDGYLNLEVLPIKWLYELYRNWYAKNVSKHNTPLKSNLFTRRLKTILADKGFEFDNKSNRVKNIKGFPYHDLLLVLGKDAEILSNVGSINSNYYKNKNNEITQEKLELFENNLKNKNFNLDLVNERVLLSQLISAKNDNSYDYLLESILE